MPQNSKKSDYFSEIAKFREARFSNTAPFGVRHDFDKQKILSIVILKGLFISSLFVPLEARLESAKNA